MQAVNNELPEALVSGLLPWHAKIITKSQSLSKLAIRIYRKGGSPTTAGGYAKDLMIFFRWLTGEQDPDPDVLIAQKRDWPKVVNEYLDYYISKQGNARTSARTKVAAIKKWLEVNEVLSSRDLAWSTVDMPKYIRGETDQIPTKNDLRMALSAGNVRDRALVLIATSSGLRRGSLLALRYKDLDLTREIPAIKPRPETTKGKARFFTFMTPEAKQALLFYKKYREMRGETITPESYVFTVDRPRGQPYVSGVQASARWIELLRRSNLAQKGKKIYKMHFHTLRVFFRYWCSLSGVNRDVIEFLMGHRRSLEQVYFVRDVENVPEEIVKKLEEEYRKAISGLAILTDQEKVRELEGKLEGVARDRAKDLQLFELQIRELNEKVALLGSELVNRRR